MSIAPTLARYLDQHANYDMMVHEPTPSSTRTAEMCHIPGDRLAKGVVLRWGDGYLLAVIPASHHIELPELQKQLGDPIALASENEIGELFRDCVRGAIPPIGDCYGLDMVSFLASALLIASVAIRRPPPTAAAAESSRNRIHGIWIDMRQGMRFILHHGAILYAVFAMAAAMMITGCFGPLIAIYVRDTLLASERTFGVVSGMIGVGLLVGAQIVRKLTAHVSDNTLVLSGLAGIGGGVLLLGAVPHVAASLLGTFVIGFAFGAIMVPAQTLIQRETPHDMLGRVGSTNASIIFLGQVVGLAFSGVLAETIGVRMVFFLCAALAIATAAAGRVFLHTRAS